MKTNGKGTQSVDLSMDQIAVACALEYTKFRFTDKWTKDCVILDKWLKIFNQKDFMKNTIPKESV